MDRFRITNPEARRTPRPTKSCQLCSVRKLKCDWKRPCANCQVRGVTCETQVYKRPRRRLNEPYSGQPVKPPIVNPSSKRLSDAQKASRAELEHLEKIGVQEQFCRYDWSDGLTFIMRPISDYQTPDDRPGTPGHSLPSSTKMGKEVYYPLKREALVLFYHYAENVCHIHYIHHLPSLQALLDNLYTRLPNHQPIALGSMCLILSVLAAAAYSLSSIYVRTALFPNSDMAMQACLSWTQAALDVLEHSRRSESGSVEEVQALIVLTFLIYNLEGFSARVRLFHSMALTIARDLSLHITDGSRSRKGKARSVSVENEIEREVKRRVWWHLLGTDWILALTGGPQEGTYFANPKHTKVDLPRNIHTEDLYNESLKFVRPPSEPTPMSYFLQRVHLAKLCQRIVDRLPLGIVDPTEIDYKNIVAADHDFNTLLAELPVFFRLDEASRQSSQEIDRKLPYIPLQRYTLSLQINARRCKLHQPFLLHTSLEAPSNFSRGKCLQSARTVIEVMKLLQKERSPFTSRYQRFYGIIHGVFIATVVLVMDLCVNKIPAEEEQRKAEVLDACSVLERAKSQSPTAEKFLESLMDILRKNKIVSRDANLATTKSPGSSEVVSEESSSSPRQVASQTMVVGGHTPGVHRKENTNMEPTFFDEIWGNYVNNGSFFDMLSWNTIFVDLDTHYMHEDRIASRP